MAPKLLAPLAIYTAARHQNTGHTTRDCGHARGPQSRATGQPLTGDSNGSPSGVAFSDSPTSAMTQNTDKCTKYTDCKIPSMHPAATYGKRKSKQRTYQAPTPGFRPQLVASPNTQAQSGEAHPIVRPVSHVCTPS